MEKEKYQIAWYRMRGLGLVCLCSLVFFMGAYVTNQRTITTSSTVSGWKGPVCCVQTQEKKAALTFEASFGTGQIEPILNILDKYGVKATFFVTGNWVDQYPEYVKEIAARGHELGNRSQNHTDMGKLSKAEIQAELQQVHSSVQQLTGKEMKVFRAPYGDYSGELLGTVKQSGYLPIEWNVDTEDWKDYGIESIIKKATEDPQLSGGSIIRMHSDANYTAQALETVIWPLQEQGYELVPVSELVYWSDYLIDAQGMQVLEREM